MRSKDEPNNIDVSMKIDSANLNCKTWKWYIWWADKYTHQNEMKRDVGMNIREKMEN